MRYSELIRVMTKLRIIPIQYKKIKNTRLTQIN